LGSERLKHELAQLVGQIDWDFIDVEAALHRQGAARNPDVVRDRA
jgi:hypothetical protein